MTRKAVLPAAIGLAGTLALSFAGPARADVTDDLLRQLREKGILSQGEYNVLLDRKRAEEKATAQGVQSQPTVSPAQAIDPSTMIQRTESGVGFRVGEVEVKLSGSINGYYVHEWGDDNPGAVVGGLAGAGDSTSIRNGLLPGFLKFDITTVQDGWEVGAHFGIYPGINSVSWDNGANSPGVPAALATSGIDFRQTYLTIARPELGELKIGRDIGLFGSEAILNDITLLSVGTAGGNAAPSNTSLGRIGLGYVYTDFQPQITYTTPSFAGFQAAVGVFQPLVTAGANEVNDEPGFQAELTYDLGSAGFVQGLGGKLWASMITQDHDPVGTVGGYRGTGYDVGAKLTFGPAGFVGYYYTGEGLGTTGLFILATDAAGNERDSDGFYVQGSFEVMPKLTLAASYGESRLDLAPGEVNPTLLDVNKSWVGQVQYALTDWVTLIGEYINTTSEAQNGNEIDSDAIALGAILFF